MNIQKKIKFLQKLADAGFKDEAAIQTIDLGKALSIKGVTMEELNEIAALQTACKNHKILTWLFADTTKTIQE